MGEGQSRMLGAKAGAPSAGPPVSSLAAGDIGKADIADLQKRCAPRPLRPGYEAPPPAPVPAAPGSAAAIQELRGRCVPKGLRSEFSEAAVPGQQAPAQVGIAPQSTRVGPMMVASQPTAVPQQAPAFVMQRSDSMYRTGGQMDVVTGPIVMPRSESMYRTGGQMDVVTGAVVMPRSESMYRTGGQADTSAALQQGVAGPESVLFSVPRSDSMYRNGANQAPVFSLPRSDSMYRNQAQMAQAAAPSQAPVFTVPRSDSMYRNSAQMPQPATASSAQAPMPQPASARSVVVPMLALPRADSKAATAQAPFSDRGPRNLAGRQPTSTLVSPRIARSGQTSARKAALPGEAQQGLLDASMRNRIMKVQQAVRGAQRIDFEGQRGQLDASIKVQQAVVSTHRSEFASPRSGAFFGPTGSAKTPREQDRDSFFGPTGSAQVKGSSVLASGGHSQSLRLAQPSPEVNLLLAPAGPSQNLKWAQPSSQEAQGNPQRQPLKVVKMHEIKQIPQSSPGAAIAKTVNNVEDAIAPAYQKLTPRQNIIKQAQPEGPLVKNANTTPTRARESYAQLTRGETRFNPETRTLRAKVLK